MSDMMETKGKDISVLSDEFKTRRRLLKASAAAPLIATLSPNAAAAIGSVGQCALNGIEDDAIQSAEPITATPDKVVRVHGLIYTKGNNNNTQTIYRVPSDAQDYYDSDFNYLSSPPNDLLSGNSWTEESGYFLRLFHINEDGSLMSPTDGTTFFRAPADSYALAATCWTSIMAAP